MKKKIAQELYTLAEKILSNKGNNDISALKAHTLRIYEKLSVLEFTERFIQEGLEFDTAKTPEAEELAKSEQQARQKNLERDKERASYFAPDGTEYSDADAITEPNTEKIKNIVSQMPPEADQFHNLFQDLAEEFPRQPEDIPQPQEPKQHQMPISPEDSQQAPPPQKPREDDAPREESKPSQPEPSPRENTQDKQPTQPREEQPETPEKDEPKQQRGNIHDFGVDYDSLPKFEPVNQNGKVQRPRSLNDRLKKGINIGLNERLSFIKHLFEGNTADYNRVLSQLNTFDSLEEANKFIQLVVKPDYNNWEGKEEHEQRFLEKIENKFS